MKGISRRDFLKELTMLGSGMMLSNVLFSQSLDEKVQKAYNSLKQRMTDALAFKGDYITRYNFEIEKQKNQPMAKMNIRFEYLHGPRGGKGELRVLFYLDENSWYCNKGIDELRVWFFSTKRTNISSVVKEINMDQYRGLATYMSMEDRLLEGDLLNKKIEKAAYTILKKLNIKKKDVKEVLFAKDLIKEIIEYSLKSKVIEMGNSLTRDAVKLKEFQYKGYGFLDTDEQLRAPKLVEIRIPMGELSIEAFGFRGIIRDYKRVFDLKIDNIFNSDFDLGIARGTNKTNSIPAYLFAPFHLIELLEEKNIPYIKERDPKKESIIEAP